MSRGGVRQAVALSLSAAFLVLIYTRLDLAALRDVFSMCRVDWLVASLAMTVPTALLTSLRLKIMSPDSVGIQLGEAIRLTLAAAVLNMVLPSKMGDLAKAFFIRDRDQEKTAVAVPLVIFEKTCDVLALLAWCGLGLVALPKDDWRIWLLSAIAVSMLVAGVLVLGSKTVALFFFGAVNTLVPIAAIRGAVARIETAWEQMHAYFWGRGGRLVAVIAISLATWFLHLLQIWMFIVALRGSVPFVHSMGLTALSIFAGLVLPAYAGIGTRDLALIYFYRSYLSPETAAALGILCTSRYVIPALAGLPFFNRYLATVKK